MMKRPIRPSKAPWLEVKSDSLDLVSGKEALLSAESKSKSDELAAESKSKSVELSAESDELAAEPYNPGYWTKWLLHSMKCLHDNEMAVEETDLLLQESLNGDHNDDMMAVEETDLLLQESLNGDHNDDKTTLPVEDLPSDHNDEALPVVEQSKSLKDNDKALPVVEDKNMLDNMEEETVKLKEFELSQSQTCPKLIKMTHDVLQRHRRPKSMVPVRRPDSDRFRSGARRRRRQRRSKYADNFVATKVQIGKLRYSQESCKQSFQCGISVWQLVQDLLDRKVSLSAHFLCLTVFETDERDPRTNENILRCIDNRRLFALKEYAKKSGKDRLMINVKVFNLTTLTEVCRFIQNSDETPGEDVRLRQERQLHSTDLNWNFSVRNFNFHQKG